MHSATKRSITVLVTVVALVLATLLPGMAAEAHADSGIEGQFVSRINQERESRGLQRLSVSSDMVSVARSHSARMADQNHLHHNPNFGTQVTGWRKVGENVGRGPSVSALHRAFMDSPSHRQNILDPDWTQVGIGVVVDDGVIWVTQLFRLPTGASASPPPAPEPEPERTREPDPEPEPSPAPRPSPSPAPSPSPSPAPAPSAPEFEPHEVVDRVLGFDRVTVTLARLERLDGSTSIAELLAAADEESD